nr:hypothetical protein [Bacillus pumilus]
MNSLLIMNLIAFAAVTAYAVYLFIYLIRTRAAYIRLGKKEEFQQDMKRRLERVWVNVFGQKKLLKDKKSGIIHVLFFYGFILVQFGALDFIMKGLVPGRRTPFRSALRCLYLFPRGGHTSHFSSCCLGIP